MTRLRSEDGQWTAYGGPVGCVRPELAQKGLSAIQFVVPKRLGWDADTNVVETEAQNHADIYVFALLAQRDKATIDPPNLAQWQFWAVPTADLDSQTRSQHSITLRSLYKLARDPAAR